MPKWGGLETGRPYFVQGSQSDFFLPCPLSGPARSISLIGMEPAAVCWSMTARSQRGRWLRRCTAFQNVEVVC